MCSGVWSTFRICFEKKQLSVTRSCIAVQSPGTSPAPLRAINQGILPVLIAIPGPKSQQRSIDGRYKSVGRSSVGDGRRRGATTDGMAAGDALCQNRPKDARGDLIL